MVEEADPLLARSPRARSRWTWKIGIAAMVIIGVVFAIAAANAGLRGEIGAAATLGKQPEGTGKKASVGLAAEARNAAAKTAAVGDDDADETAPAPAPANETVPADDVAAAAEETAAAANATAPAPAPAAETPSASPEEDAARANDWEEAEAAEDKEGTAADETAAPADETAPAPAPAPANETVPADDVAAAAEETAAAANATAPAPAPANETVPANDAAPAPAPAPSAAASADVADYEANAEAEPAKDTMAAVIEITVKNDETVTTAPGDTYTLFIHNSKTVAQLKARVKDLDGVPPERQILFFNGTRLEKDGKALREYDIETGDTVTVHHTSYWKKDA